MPLSTVEGAMRLAASAHGGQVDRAGAPYVLHAARVGATLWRFGDLHVIAGLLHDVVEDTRYGLGDLERMGLHPDALAAVDAVTKRRNETHEEAIRRAMADPIGLWVKAADVLDNASRVHGLEVPTRRRLEAKYARAVEVLREAIPRLRLGADLGPSLALTKPGL